MRIWIVLCAVFSMEIYSFGWASSDSCGVGPKLKLVWGDAPESDSPGAQSPEQLLFLYEGELLQLRAKLKGAPGGYHPGEPHPHSSIKHKELLITLLKKYINGSPAERLDVLETLRKESEPSQDLQMYRIHAKSYEKSLSTRKNELERNHRRANNPTALHSAEESEIIALKQQAIYMTTVQLERVQKIIQAMETELHEVQTLLQQLEANP